MREWLYQRLSNDAELLDILRLTTNGVPETDIKVQDRMFSGGSMTTASTPKPFVVYQLGNRTDQVIAEEDYRAYRQFWQIWVHDKPWDYTRIDAALDRIEDIFQGAQSPADGVSFTFHIERSRDFDDDILKTVFKYARFQSVIQKRVSAA